MPIKFTTSFLFIICIATSGCHRREAPVDNFIPPKLSAEIDSSAVYLSPNSMLNTWYNVERMDSICEHINLAKSNNLIDSFSRGMVYTKQENEPIISNRGLKLFVDTSQELSKSNSIWADYLFPSNLKALMNGEKENARPIVVKAFPIYLVNLSHMFAKVEAQDGSLIMTLEAKNKKGKWAPVENWSYSWCGNSYHSYLIPPKYMLLTMGIKYTGNFITTARVKLETREHSIYSPPFNLSVNLEQFKAKEKR